ncbi:helix-turn-helix transcriptional regulator [Amycolatopsis sp. 195334CR]|uniref:helix-turn-helix domain-containing protein n=1 Tax=Amycolatopsis sp. 195334CR TaxID=2814588 RepID=UPI001A8ED831|nr:helix-turn-helix transcriptional regulator [Amycolatopsis sp. 195334CR]MBN6038517.1 helix-turn-helix transcriptional regulator [Amycolatopsis sp. 195334CR]
MRCEVGQAVTGRAVDRLVEQVRTTPKAVVRAVVSAPGGYGKSTLIAEVSAAYTAAGFEVLDAVALTTRDLGDRHGSAVVIDDAHLLGDHQLNRLREVVRSGYPRVVLTQRPAPRPAALRALATEIGEVVPLGPLTTAQTGVLAAAHGTELGDDRIERLHRHTGGVPRFVARIAGLDGLDGFRSDLALLPDDVLRYLIAAEAGATADTDLLDALFGPGRAAVVELARASGLLGHDGRLVPVAADAIRRLCPAPRRVEVLHRMAEIQLRSGQPVEDLAGRFLAVEITGPTAAEVFVRAAEETAVPRLSAEFFAAAAAAGPRSADLVANWARAAALAGDLDTALRLSDELLSSAHRESQAEGALIAGLVLGRRGELVRSAELFRFAGVPAAANFAVVAETAVGRRATGPPAPALVPTLSTAIAERLGTGLAESISDTPARALPTLFGAADLVRPKNPAALLPDSPAALAGIAAMHWGELGPAEAILETAAAGESFAARHHLLLAWVSLLRGDLPAAAQRARQAGAGLDNREELFAAALELGIARRSSNLPALRRAWSRAYPALLRNPVNLFLLLPLNEIAIAAARLGERSSFALTTEQITTTLAALGNPPLWATATAWSRFYAAIVTDDADAARAELSTLESVAGAGRYPAALAEAGGAWLSVLAGQPDADRVTAAASGLRDLGFVWDAARLAGQAAIRTSDRQAMTRLLETARQFQGRSREDAAGTTSVTTPEVELSRRERQVAELVVEGLTYKQVGAQLYISGKTVEHHMARIRSKTGITDRGELLGTLRSLITGN